MAQLPTKRPERSHIFERVLDGWYQEPSWCSRRLFDTENFFEGERTTIYDPACGVGTIMREAKAAGYDAFGCDIIKRFRGRPDFEFEKRDFLQPHALLPNSTSIVCNPPFDHVEEFCRRACALKPYKVAMIMLVRRLNAAHWLQELPLQCIYLLTPRPSMPPGQWIADGNKPGGGKQDFCWLVFQPKPYGDEPREPQIAWLHRDREGPNGQGQAP